MLTGLSFNFQVAYARYLTADLVFIILLSMDDVRQKGIKFQLHLKSYL